MSAAPVRSRRRRWARRGGAGLAVLALAGGVLLAWLLSTAGGRDTLLGRVVGLLPPAEHRQQVGIEQYAARGELDAVPPVAQLAEVLVDRHLETLLVLVVDDL